MDSHPDPYITVADLAAYWSVSRKQLYKQIEAGTLKAIRLGPRSMRINTADAAAFERAAKIGPHQEEKPPREYVIEHWAQPVRIRR